MRHETRAIGTILIGALCVVICTILAGPGTARGQVFLKDDPIQEDPDQLDMPAPAPHDIGDYYDFWINTFGNPAAYDGPALNANTLGEVPESSWYTPRHYWESLSLAQLQEGPNRVDGPSEAGPWRVVAGKLEGKTAGLQIEDARGDRYLLKFDAPGHIELASGAEVVSTRLLYALGYHVPENFAVRFRRAQLTPGDGATFETAAGDLPITQARIDTVLAAAARYADGSVRALASRFLDGDPVGPFLYYGTRPDDANDVIPHELRRELRGLRVIAAWLNHTDARSINTLDMVVRVDGRQFVRHHLIDFGSTLGAGPYGPRRRWDGYEYIIDGPAIGRRVFTLGLVGLEWAADDYPDLPSVGLFDAERFDPTAWKPQYPNAAFLQCDADDAFWAAKQIMRFTDEELEAVVRSADYSDATAEKRIVEVLSARRDRIGRAYLSHGGGLDRFEVQHGFLTFDDLRVEHGFEDPERVRHVVWRVFDNETGRAGPIMAADRFVQARLTIPRTDDPYLVVEIRTPAVGSTRVFLRGQGSDRHVVGVERSRM